MVMFNAHRQLRSDSLIFVVEDDLDISHLIAHNLNLAGYRVSEFPSAHAVIPSAMNMDPALFLLDIMMPEISGFDLCRQIREHWKLAHTPVIFLSARSAETDRMRGFELGGDDYIVKPFSPRELIARVRSVLRGQPDGTANEIIGIGDLEIDVASMTVRVQGRAVSMTTREFRLLEYLARHRGRVFSRDQLLDAVWKENSHVISRSIDVYIRRLREKIERDPACPQYLKTLRGVGYRLDARSDLGDQ